MVLQGERKKNLNHTNGKLRNVIELAIGSLKAHFSILERIEPYQFHTQIHIVITYNAIHDFL